MKPNKVMPPVPEWMARPKCCHDENRVERKEVGRESNDEIIAGYHDVSTFGGGFEFFHTATEQPGPDRVSEFMAEDIDQHRFGQ